MVREPRSGSVSLVTVRENRHIITIIKTPLSSSLLISLRHESVKGVSYIRTNISADGSCFIGVFTEVR